MMHGSIHVGAILAMLCAAGCEQESTPPQASPAVEAAPSVAHEPAALAKALQHEGFSGVLVRPLY